MSRLTPLPLPFSLSPHARLVVGLNAVREAVAVHGKAMFGLVIDSRESPRLEALARFGADQGLTCLRRVSRSELDQWSQGHEHQGVLAWAPPLRLIGLSQILEQPNFLAIALDRVQDPQNFGAVIRSAVAVADAAIIFAEHSAAPLTPATFRASAGAIEHARLCRVSSLRQALVEIRDRGVRVLGLDPHAPLLLHECANDEPTVVVLGSEHEGLQRSTRKLCSELVRLSATSRVDSLNASVAAGIALHTLAIHRSRGGD